MKRSLPLLLGASIIITTMLLLITPPVSGQCCASCGGTQPPDPGPIISPRAGYTLPARGKVNALVVFIDFEDETEDTNNVNWPRGSGPVGIGPGFKGLFIDQTPVQQSGLKFNITTFYRDMSFGQLTIVGYPVYKRARRTKAAYDADIHTTHQIPYWATRDVLQSLTPQDVGDWRQFDSLTVNDKYSQSTGPDGVIDYVIVWFRGLYDPNNGWSGEGVANLGRAGDYFIANGTLKVKAGDLGCGVICQHGLLYPDCSVPFHETGHFLLGGDERYLDDNYGLWTVMGYRGSDVSYCMNAYEREQLGWITFRDAADGLETDIPDFATTGIAYRMSYPNFDNHLEYYFENHQRLPSPYIKSAEDGIFSYDVVDRFNLQGGGAPGQKGLYIVEKEGALLRVVCADGRWDWGSTGHMDNPFNPAVQAQIFRHSDIDRTRGRTDRRLQRGSRHNVPYEDLIYVWLDEVTGQPTWTSNTRKDGDANDAWKPDGNNIFSPWSNPAARFGYNPDLFTGAMQVTAENPDGSVHVKFFTTNLEWLPPSLPQAFVAEPLQGFDGIERPSLTWIKNVEPAVAAGGTVEVWRQLEPYGEAAGPWVRIATLPPNDTSFIDQAIGGVRLNGGGNAVRYRMRVIDSNNQASNYVKERTLYYGDNPLKVVVRGTAVPGSAEVVTTAWLENRDVVVHSSGAAIITAHLYDMLGREVGALKRRERGTGECSFTLDTPMLLEGRYYCIVSANGMPAAWVPVMVVR